MSRISSILEIYPTRIQNCLNFTFLAEVAGGHGFVEPLLDLMIDELHKGIVLGGGNESLLFHFTICTFLIPLQSVQKTQRKTCSESFCWRIWSYSARTCSTRSAHIRSAETKFNLDFADQLLKLHSWKALPIMLICLRVKIGLSGFVGVAAATAGALADELLVPACQSKGVSAKRTDNSTENLRKALPAFESLCQKYHTNFFL